VAMRPYNGGGEMIREVARDWITYGDPPHKFEAGTPAIVEAVGIGAAIDYVNSIGKERIAAHEHDLVTYAQDRLREINSLRLIGTARGKGPVISFELKGAHAHDVATVIDRQGVAVRAGTHLVCRLLPGKKNNLHGSYTTLSSSKMPLTAHVLSPPTAGKRSYHRGTRGSACA